MPFFKLLEIRSETLVGATVEDLTDPVEDGKRAIVKYFGAAIPINGVVDLHWGSVAGWQYVRSIAATTYEFSDLNEDFIGDGIKRFRITRTKTGGGGPLAIKTWFKAIEQN